MRASVPLTGADCFLRAFDGEVRRLTGASHLSQLVLRLGPGFDPEEIPDPLAPENIMKGSGRGILFMRNYMDDVSLSRHPEGGMQIWMKTRPATPAAS